MDDFIIIGGGIAGLCAGASLAKHGTVTLLEGEEALGFHASSRSAAIFIPTYGAASVTALTVASADALHDTGLTKPRGIMAIGRAGEDEAFAEVAGNLALNPISVADALLLMPILDGDVITAAGHREDAWDIDTDALLQLYARDIRANGQIVTRAPVTAIRKGDGWEVEAGGTTYRARKIINAAGPWVDAVAEMAGIAPIGFSALRRSMARIDVPGDVDASGWPLVTGAHENWYSKPDAGALIVSPAEEDPCEPMDAWADDMVLAEGLMHFEEHITGEVTRMLANWAGLRTFAPDRQLVIGEDPTAEGFFWMAGQGGYGFQTAPAAGWLIAALASGTAPEFDRQIVEACAPARFR
ncbi:MAG: FAD-binding oxidoreductase [Pseudomonadota bacterium]|nr:FAD-binding oxidoreductase [Pseudomonadota bacterium]